MRRERVTQSESAAALDMFGRLGANAGETDDADAAGGRECWFCGEFGAVLPRGAKDGLAACADISACGARYAADDGTSANPGEMRRRRDERGATSSQPNGGEGAGAAALSLSRHSANSQS